MLKNKKLRLLVGNYPQRMFAPKRREEGQPKADNCGQGGQGSPKCGCRTEKNVDFHFFIIIWRYFLSNVNSIFEYSVLDKIRLDCKVYPSHPFASPYTHIHTFYIYYELTT